MVLKKPLVINTNGTYEQLQAADVLDAAAVSGYRGIVTVTASKTVALTDANTLQYCINSSAITITIPKDATLNLGIGTEIEITPDGTETVTIAQEDSAVSIRRYNSAAVTGHAIIGRYAACSLKKVGANEWRVYNRDTGLGNGIDRVFGINRRQAIAQGSIDSVGLPNAITTSAGLNAQINASSTTPIVCNFAAGFDVSGIPIDYTGIYTSNQSYSSLTANTTHYFYLGRDTSTGVLTPTRITIAPVYSRVAPTSPSTGLHWFKTSQDSLSTQPGMTMYEWNGSIWVARQRVFIGEVTTNASAVTSVANYAYDRRYQSAWLSASSGQLINFSHNLGSVADAEATFAVHGRLNSSDAPTFVPTYIGEAGISYGCYPRGGTRNSIVLHLGTNVLYTSESWRTAAEYSLSIQSGW